MQRKIKIAFLIAVCTFALILLAAGLYVHEGRGAVEQVDIVGKAYVEEVEGTKVVYLSGKPYELGYAHGMLLKKDVQEMMNFSDSVLDEICKQRHIPQFVATYILDFIYKRCSPHIPDRYKRELEGLADGAGVNLQMLRRAHVTSVIIQRGCSNLAVFEAVTVNGKLYHGHNFDFDMELGLQDRAALFIYHPKGFIPFVLAGSIGLIGGQGMNIEGVSIGAVSAITNDNSFSGIPLFFLQRRILEECCNVKDAVALIQDARRTVGYNYVVADGKTKVARALETTAQYCAVFRDDDPKEEQAPYSIRIKGAVFRADEAMDQTVRRYQSCANGYPNMPYGSNSYDHRYKGMATLIKENYGKIDASVALEILRAVAMRNVNVQSVLFANTDLEMWVAHAHGMEDAWKQRYVHYDLKKMFSKTKESKEGKHNTQYQDKQNGH